MDADDVYYVDVRGVGRNSGRSQALTVTCYVIVRCCVRTGPARLFRASQRYVHLVLRTARDKAHKLACAVEFYGAPTSALRQHRSLAEAATPAGMPNPLFHKQAIIVLREELEYFAIPPLTSTAAGSSESMTPQQLKMASTDEHGTANEALMSVKAACGQHLLGRKSIFTALQRNVNRENNIAEQHLIDMLCMRWVVDNSGLVS